MVMDAIMVAGEALAVRTGKRGRSARTHNNYADHNYADRTAD